VCDFGSTGYYYINKIALNIANFGDTVWPIYTTPWQSEGIA
jgi:hypothetical protein